MYTPDTTPATAKGKTGSSMQITPTSKTCNEEGNKSLHARHAELHGLKS